MTSGRRDIATKGSRRYSSDFFDRLDCETALESSPHLRRCAFFEFNFCELASALLEDCGGFEEDLPTLGDWSLRHPESRQSVSVESDA